MRVRAVQLVCMVLLLSSLGTAESSTLHPSSNASGIHRIGAFFAQESLRAANDTSTGRAFRPSLVLDVAISDSMYLAAPLPMRPAALHTAATHAVTGSSL